MECSACHRKIRTYKSLLEASAPVAGVQNRRNSKTVGSSSSTEHRRSARKKQNQPLPESMEVRRKTWSGFTSTEDPQILLYKRDPLGSVFSLSKTRLLKPMEWVEMMGVQRNRVRVKRKTVEAVLQQCQFALQQLATSCDDDGDDDDNIHGEFDVSQDSDGTLSTIGSCNTDTTEQFYGLLKSRVESADFLQKLENAHASLPENIAEEGSSWDMVSENDIWEGGNVELDPEDYVLVGQEDIMDGIASFMAAYLLSLKQTKVQQTNEHWTDGRFDGQA
ncbi:hypothetical protein OROGR_013635 [Orobanche gracilis]